MKVLFVTGLTGFGIGGVRTEEIHLIGGSIKKGFEVGFCCDVLAPELTGVPHFKVDYPPGEKAPEQVATALEEFKPDLVHVTGGGVRFLQVCDRQFAKTPWVFTAHNIPPAERIFPHFYANARLHYGVRNLLGIANYWTWSRFLKTARYGAVICHSKAVSTRVARAGCREEKIHLIPIGTEAPAEGLSSDGSTPSPFPADSWPKILTVAGLAFHKGQLDGLRLAARLLPDFPKLSYRLIGMTRDKKYRAYLEKMIGDLGLANHASILHSAPEAVKVAALREADLYVQPSHEEGYCLGFLEAAMLSPRLLGADTGAIAAMAEGDATAQIVKVGDVGAMERAARALLARPVEAGAVQARRETLVRKFSWERYFDSHLKTYQSVLGERNA